MVVTPSAKTTFELVSPERLLLSQAVDMVVVPGAEGLFAALVVLPFGWVACRLVNIIRFKRSWTVGVVTQAKWWGGSKIALRERFPTKAAAEVRARELEAHIGNTTFVLPTKSSLTGKRPHMGHPDPGR